MKKSVSPKPFIQSGSTGPVIVLAALVLQRAGAIGDAVAWVFMGAGFVLIGYSVVASFRATFGATSARK
jgi:hypothetical protein